MKKLIRLICLALASVATLAACGGSSGNIKIAIKDLEGKSTLSMDPYFGTASTYVCFDEKGTDLGGRLPSSVNLKANSSSVSIAVYGYSKEVKDYKWKVTFSEAGTFTITATMDDKDYGTVSYTVNDSKHAKINYRSPKATNVGLTCVRDDLDGEPSYNVQALKIGDEYMRVGYKQYHYFVPEGNEGLYRRYILNFGETTWKKSKATYQLGNVVDMVYQDFARDFSGNEYKSKTSENVTVTTVTSAGSKAISYDCTKYTVSDDTYSISDNDDFCLCLKILDDKAIIKMTLIDYTLSSFPVVPTVL